MNKKRDRKEIVYINQSSGYLMVDIINAKDSSYRKTLLAGNIVERNNKLDENVKVRYTIPYNRKNKITRNPMNRISFATLISEYAEEAI